MLFLISSLTYELQLTNITRLEAATSRLEDLAASQAPGALAPSSKSPHIAPDAPPPSVQAAVEDPRIVIAFNETVIAKLEPFVQLSGELSPVLKEQVGPF